MSDRPTSPIEPHDLDRAAEGIAIPSGDVDAVIARGRRIGARRRNGTVLLTVVAMVAAGAGLANALDTDGARETPVAADGGAVLRGDSGITWRVATPSSGLTGLGINNTTVGDGPIYALSTAAGERPSETTKMNGVVWRSVDGVDWVTASRVDDDVHFADLAASDGRIYAVGTTAATTATGSRATRGAYDLVAGWSDDDGASFERTQLPFSLRELAEPGATVGVSGASVASGPKGTMIVLALSGSLDVRKLLPDGVDAPNGWVTTNTGVDILGDERNGCVEDGVFDKLDRVEQPTEMGGFYCAEDRDGAKPIRAQDVFGVSASYTFAELGVGAELQRAIRRQPVAFHAPPGSTDFVEVEVPDTAPLYGPPYVDAHENGFDVVSSAGAFGVERQEVVALHSADGRSFSPSRTLPDLAWVTAVGRVQGRTTIIGGASTGSVIARSTGDGDWTTTPLTAAIDPEVADGRTATAYVAGIGPFGIVVSALLHDHHGESKLDDTRILVSRDGERWSDTPLRDLVGDRKVRGVPRIVVTSNRTVITVATGECNNDCEGPSDQIAVIGVSS